MRSGLDLLAQPDALLVAAEVLDLIGNGAAVGVAQPGKDVGEGRTRHVHAEHVGGDRGHQRGSEPDGLRFHRRIAQRRRAQRVEMGTEVAMGAVSLDQRHARAHRGEDLVAGGPCRRRLADTRDRLLGEHGHRGHVGRRRQPEAGEDSRIEAVGAVEQLLDPAQELARLRALDDAMVVGAGHGHDLAHPEIAQPRLSDVAQAGWEVDRAGGDDRPLSAHQPRNRRDGAESARVGQGDAAAAQLVDGQGVGARLGNKSLVLVAEGAEVAAGGVANDGDDQRAAASELA